MKKGIGVFDSGLGGLTVVKELMKKLPFEDIIYFGDTARLPYGSKSPHIITQFSFENTEFLLKQNIKFLVVACNTASSFSLVQLERNFDLPMVGVITPGASAAIKATVNKKIGVIGTSGTINSQSYVKALKKIDPAVKIFTQPCPLFVPLVEEGWINKEVTFEIAAEYLKELKKYNIDTLILGCTHYPLLKNIVARVMGPKVTLIDSAKATAETVKELLVKNKLTAKEATGGKHRFFVSDLSANFIKIGQRFLGQDKLSIKQVNLGWYIK
jgi:glutamate racemase